MKVSNFFPLSIFQDQIKLNNEEKINLINDIRKMKQNSQNSDYKLNQASWTGDTQGYEYEVLKGSIKSLKHINLIQIELSLVNLYKNQVNWLKVLNFLEKKNFRVIKFFDGFKNKKNNEFLQID